MGGGGGGTDFAELEMSWEGKNLFLLYCSVAHLYRCVTGSIILHSSSFHDGFYINKNNSTYSAISVNLMECS